MPVSTFIEGHGQCSFFTVCIFHQMFRLCITLIFSCFHGLWLAVGNETPMGCTEETFRRAGALRPGDETGLAEAPVQDKGCSAGACGRDFSVVAPHLYSFKEARVDSPFLPGFWMREICQTAFTNSLMQLFQF